MSWNLLEELRPSFVGLPSVGELRLLLLHTSKRISKTLGLCLNCIRSHKDEALKISLKVHAQSRIKWNLPGLPPYDPDGIKCNLCMNQCQIPENGFGYCGLRRNDNGRIEGVTASKGKYSQVGTCFKAAALKTTSAPCNTALTLW